MAFKVSYIPAEGRSLYGKKETTTTTVSTGGYSGGGSGGYANHTYMEAYTTSTGDTAGQWTISGHTIPTLTDGTTIKVKLSTGHYPTNVPIANQVKYNTLDIGLPFMPASGESTTATTFLVWYEYNKELKQEYDTNTELMLTFRENAGSYTVANNNGPFPSGTVITNGWVIESQTNYWTLTSVTSGDTTIEYLATDKNVVSSGDVCCYGMSAITSGITGLTVVDDLSGGTSAHTENVLSAWQGKVLNEAISGRQETLVSGTNIKTINGQSLLGAGNIIIEGGGGGTGSTAWSAITGTPTTISGYGITDAVTTYGNQTIDGVKSFIQNVVSSGDVICYGASGIIPSGLTVVDNLTSTSTTDALSANQGRLLNNNKQDKLTSGVTIKTINGQSLLGSGNITIQGGGGSSDWRDITNKPTTISGYGITDAFTTAQTDERYVNVASAQTVTGKKSFTQTITTSGDVVSYGASEIVPSGLSVIDNLSSTSTTDALSANQGRVLNGYISGKQATLVSGSNIKTINGQSLLGSGNITIQGGGASYTAGNNISLAGNVISVTGINSSYITNALGYTPLSAETYTGTVSQIKLGSTAYNPSSGIVSLPAYPTTLPASDVYSWAKAQNKPSYSWSEISSKPTFAAVATSGAYGDLSGRPSSLPASDVYSWAKQQNKPSYSWSEITSKPSFATVATSGSYNDLSNKPSIPTKTSQLTNDSGFITSASIPTKTSQLTNDSGYITSSATVDNSTKWNGYKIVVNGSGSASDTLYIFY